LGVKAKMVSCGGYYFTAVCSEDGFFCTFVSGGSGNLETGVKEDDTALVLVQALVGNASAVHTLSHNSIEVKWLFVRMEEESEVFLFFTQSNRGIA